jgi:anti-sigma factor RsiW
MSITDEELAAFADDELDGERNAAVAKAVADDPALARKVDQHRALRAKLGDHFAPVLEDEVPTHLKDLLEPKDRVVDFARAKEAKRKGDGIRWGWIAAPALAASLALAVFLPRGSGVPEGYANADLAEALDTQLVASQAPTLPRAFCLASNETTASIAGLSLPATVAGSLAGTKPDGRWLRRPVARP